MAGLAGQSKNNENLQSHYLLHREFGHNFLPKLLQSKKFGHAVNFDGAYQQATDLAKKYVAHVTSAVKGLVQQLFLSVHYHQGSSTKNLQTTLRLLKIWF